MQREKRLLGDISFKRSKVQPYWPIPYFFCSCERPIRYLMKTKVCNHVHLSMAWRETPVRDLASLMASRTISWKEGCSLDDLDMVRRLSKAKELVEASNSNENNSKKRRARRTLFSNG